MDVLHLRVFQQQIEIQCRYVLISASQLDQFLLTQNIPGTFYAIQNLLNATANISKALWGERGRHEQERATLRTSLSVSDDSPVRATTMRNNFEHLDSRIDQWWRESTQHNFVDQNIGPKGLRLFDDIDTFRWFDPGAATLVFWGQEFDIRAIVAEVRRILPLVTVEAAKSTSDATVRREPTSEI